MRWLTHLHFRVELEGAFFPIWASLACSPQRKLWSTCVKVPRKRGNDETHILFCHRPREEDPGGDSRWWQGQKFWRNPGACRVGEQRLEEGTQGQGETSVWPSFPSCPRLTPCRSIQQPGSLRRPLRRPFLRMWPGFPWLPTSWLPAGSPAASCLWEGRLPVPTWLWFGSSPGAFSSSPSSPFGRFCLFPSHGASAPCWAPRSITFLSRSSCAFCWLTQLLLSLTTEVMSSVTVNRK